MVFASVLFLIPLRSDLADFYPCSEWFVLQSFSFFLYGAIWQFFFSVLNGLCFGPLPYSSTERSGRFFSSYEQEPEGGDTRRLVSCVSQAVRGTARRLGKILHGSLLADCFVGQNGRIHPNGSAFCESAERGHISHRAFGKASGARQGVWGKFIMGACWQTILVGQNG